MTRLSDLMWHTVKHAPVDETITADSAIARVRARRLARWGWIGGGLVVVAGIIGTSVLIPGPNPNTTPEPGSQAIEPSPTASRSLQTGYGLFDSWWGMCETKPFSLYPPGDTDFFSLAADLEPGTVVDPGDTLDFTATLTALADVDVITDGIDAVILFDDLVVGSLMSDDILQLHSFTEGEVSTVSLSVPLVVCGSTTELGAGDYELLVSQGYNPDLGGTAPQDSATSERAPRVTAVPIPFTISGDPSTNPLYQSDEIIVATSDEPPLPDNILTADIAQPLFEPLMVENDWDMAPGTSRWIIPQYRHSDEPSYYGYYGYLVDPLSMCDGFGLVDRVFPVVSANLDLYGDTVTLPSSIRLQYGWVVRDDPLLEVTRRNTTGFYLRNDGYEPQLPLFLFQDGVLAGYGLAYDVNADANQQPDPLPLSLADMDPTLYYGLVAPHTTTQRYFVWLEVHPCSTTAETSSLNPGRYTVMTSDGIYLGQGATPLSFSHLQLWTSQGTIEIID